MRSTAEFNNKRNCMLSSMLNHKRLLWAMLAVAALFAASTGSALASTTITGTVGSAGKYLVTGAPVMTTTAAVLKISFGVTTPGTNLELCAGTGADFAAANCPIRLSDSGGPGFTFLTIVDTPALAGKIIYVIRAVGIAPASFRLTIE
jgi:hypothetical protein